MLGFGTGVATGLSDVLNLRQRGQLELMMLSRRIEMEKQAHEEEAQFGSDLNKISGPQLTGLAGMLGVSPDKVQGLSNLFPNGVDKSVADSAMGALGMQSRAQAFQDVPHTTLPDANGLIQRGFANKMTGQWTAQPQTVLDPKRTDKLNQADTAYQELSANIGQVNNLAQKVLTQHPELGGIPLQNLKSALVNKGIMSSDDADSFFKTFKDFAPSVGLRLGKVQDGTVRSMLMADVDTNSLSSLSDSLQSGLMKNQEVLQTLQHKVAAVHTSYDPTDFQNSQFHPSNQNYAFASKQSQGSGADPYAGMNVQEKMSLLMNRFQSRQKQQSKTQAQ